MSSSPTVVSRALSDYVAAHAAPEDALLRELKEEAAREGVPAIWISPEQGALMEVLLRLSGAREVVEVGTLVGYSAIRMARALPAGGRVRTIELDPRHADLAERFVARSDVAGKVEVLRGAGADLLPTLASDSADAAFVDADKVGYPLYLEECLRIVRPGGLVMVDNAFAFGRVLEEAPGGDEGESVRAIRAFNDRLAADGRVDAVIVPVGDGLWVAVRR